MSCGGHMLHSVTSTRFLLHVYSCSEQVERWHGLMPGQRKVRAGPPSIFNSRSRAVHSDSISTTPFSRKDGCWWEPPHLCGGKVRLLVAHFSAGLEKSQG